MPKILIYTFSYNNIAILPFIIEYWKLYATKVIVYDNYSTDGTDIYLSQYDWITIQKYNSNDKFDLSIIKLLKNQLKHNNINKNYDYIMFSSIDEVIYNYKDISIYNNTIFYSDTYECIKDELPKYKQGILAHLYYKTTCILNNYKNKYIMFSPDTLEKINFHEKTVSYKNVNIKKIQILHLKMFGVDLYVQYLSSLYNRIINNDDIKYGANLVTSIIIKNNIYNNQYNYLYTLPIKNQIKSNIVKLYHYYEIKWEEPEITMNNIINNSCIIVIPIYKQVLSIDEERSLLQCIKILGNSYNIAICCPRSLYTEYYKLKYNYDFIFIKCNDDYFQSLYSYSWLCEEAKWYSCFKEFNYILIYLLDGWVFNNNLLYFIDKLYDYIGSPWKPNDDPLINTEMVGNGGVSLRKTDTFIRICSLIDKSLYDERHVNLEDLLYCLDLKDKLNIADINTAIEFSFDANPIYWFNKNKKLPSFAHAWKKWDYNTFWAKYINSK